MRHQKHQSMSASRLCCSMFFSHTTKESNAAVEPVPLTPGHGTGSAFHVWLPHIPALYSTQNLSLGYYRTFAFTAAADASSKTRQLTNRQMPVDSPRLTQLHSRLAAVAFRAVPRLTRHVADSCPRGPNLPGPRSGFQGRASLGCHSPPQTRNSSPAGVNRHHLEKSLHCKHTQAER